MVKWCCRMVDGKLSKGFAKTNPRFIPGMPKKS